MAWKAFEIFDNDGKSTGTWEVCEEDHTNCSGSYAEGKAKEIAAEMNKQDEKPVDIPPGP